jgi:hypothetical protein
LALGQLSTFNPLSTNLTSGAASIETTVVSLLSFHFATLVGFLLLIDNGTVMLDSLGGFVGILGMPN